MDENKRNRGPVGKMAGLKVRHMIETVENKMAAGEDPMHLSDNISKHSVLDKGKTKP